MDPEFFEEGGYDFSEDFSEEHLDEFDSSLEYQEDEEYVAGRDAYNRVGVVIGAEALFAGMDVKDVPEVQRRLKEARDIIVSRYGNLTSNSQENIFQTIKNMDHRMITNLHIPTLVFSIACYRKLIGNCTKNVVDGVVALDVIRYKRLLKELKA